MSDNYKIDFDGSSTIIQDSEGEVFAVLMDKDGCLIEPSKAELVCRLLNEDEQRILIENCVFVDLNKKEKEKEYEKEYEKEISKLNEQIWKLEEKIATLYSQQ